MVSMPLGTMMSQESQMMPAEQNFLQLVAPLIVGILFFLTALGLNQALGLTIDLWFHDVMTESSTVQNVLVSWAYSLIVFALLVFSAYVSSRYIHTGSVKLEAHGESGAGLAELPLEAI